MCVTLVWLPSPGINVSMSKTIVAIMYDEYVSHEQVWSVLRKQMHAIGKGSRRFAFDRYKYGLLL